MPAAAPLRVPRAASLLAITLAVLSTVAGAAGTRVQGYERDPRVSRQAVGPAQAASPKVGAATRPSARRDTRRPYPDAPRRDGRDTRRYISDPYQRYGIRGPGFGNDGRDGRRHAHPRRPYGYSAPGYDDHNGSRGHGHDGARGRVYDPRVDHGYGYDRDHGSPPLGYGRGYDYDRGLGRSTYGYGGGYGYDRGYGHDRAVEPRFDYPSLRRGPGVPPPLRRDPGRH